MPNQRPRYAREGFSRAFRDEGSKYFDQHEDTGAYSEIKDGYISSQTPLKGMGKEVAHIKDDGYGGFYDDDETYNTYVYKKPGGGSEEPSSQDTSPSVPASKPQASPSSKIEATDERASAKERAQNFKQGIDGTQGTDFTAV